MQSVYDLVTRFIYPYSKIITSVFIIIILVLLANYLYKTQLKTNSDKDPAIYTAINDSDVRIYIFVADWCPACKKAMPELDKFKHTYDGKTVDNRKISVNKIECGDTDDTQTARTIKAYGVTGFPTIKLFKPDMNGGEHSYEFDTKITQENLENFLQSALK